MAVTVRIGGSSAGVFEWTIEYDDATRDITTFATGDGYCLVTVQISASITRTVAYAPAGATSQNGDLAARMAAADFHVVPDGSTVVLVANVPPNQVSRVVGKPGTAIGGLPSTAEWRAS
jgi:hypothetical protein